MLYHVRMDVLLPDSINGEVRKKLLEKEKAYSQNFQRSGKWIHLWRITGEYANISIFEVSDHEELHRLLIGLPLFPYMKIKVQPLNAHPSSIHPS